MATAIALLLACGPSSRNVPERASQAAEAEPRPAIEDGQPLLRWIPADAEMVLVAENLSALEKLAGVLVPLGEALGLSLTDTALVPWLRNGIDPRGGIAIFSKGASLSLLAPLSAEALEDSAVLGAGWTQLGTQTFAAAHWSGPNEAVTGAWLDDIRAASKGKAYSSVPTAARSLIGEGSALVRGHLPIAALLAAAVGGEEYLSCLSLLRAAGGVRLSANLLKGGGVHAQFDLLLTPSASDGIAALLGPGPGAGMLGLRKTEAAHASLGIDLPLAAAALRGQDCPELASLFDDVVQQAPMSPVPRAMHAAGTRLDTSDLSGSVALSLALHNKRFFAKQLGRIPGRSLFESSIRVEGQKAKRLSIPTMTSVYYRLTKAQLLFATKKSLIGALLVPPVGRLAQHEVAAAGLWPGRLPQLRFLLRRVVGDREVADVWNDLLLRFEYAGISLVLGDSQLTLTMTVRPRS
ncbi:MAG: hypothetical protein GY811_11750 [Myxococcales bacterium]|nr:hypothetical protein [Myxococcales bacterium]